MSHPHVGKLSDLTPSVVDHLYGTTTAAPQATPTFMLIVGSPGVGKSSGHAFAIENGFVPPPSEGGYATINLDTLLESLRPFRAASAMGYVVTHKPNVKHLAKFSTLQSYMSRRENLGAFKWYNTEHDVLKVKEPELIDALDSIRERFLPLREVELPKGSSLVDLNEAAIIRAVNRSVPIIYETTLSYNKKEGRVKKVDEIMRLLEEKGPQYRVVLVHMVGVPEEIAARIHHRQEYGMPYEELPFYRYVPADPNAVIAMAKGTAEAVSAIEEQYGGRIEVIPLETAMNVSRLAAPRNFDNVALVRRIRNVYGPPAAAAAAETVALAAAALKRSSSGSSSGSRKRRHVKTSSSERRKRNVMTTQKKKRSTS